MGEFASKGIAGAALGTGIAGLSFGVLNAMCRGCGNGLLNNLFGDNCNHYNGIPQSYVDALQSKIAELTSEKYADRASADSYKASVAMAEKLDDKWTAQLGEVTREVADIRVREAQTRGKIECMERESVLRQQLTEAKINEVALTTNNGLTALAGTVNCLQQAVTAITKTVISNDAICPGWGPVDVKPRTQAAQTA